MLLYFLLPTAVPGRLRIAQLHGRCSGPSKMQPFVHIGFTRLGYGYLLGRRQKQRQRLPTIRGRKEMKRAGESPKGRFYVNSK